MSYYNGALSHFNLPCFSIYYSNLLYGISFTLFTDNIFIKPFSSAKIFIVVHTFTIWTFRVFHFLPFLMAQIYWCGIYIKKELVSAGIPYCNRIDNIQQIFQPVTGENVNLFWNDGLLIQLTNEIQPASELPAFKP